MVLAAGGRPASWRGEGHATSLVLVGGWCREGLVLLDLEVAVQGPIGGRWVVAR